MRDHDIPSNYLQLSREGDVVCTDLSFDAVFNTSLPNDKLRFSFESRYDPYQVFTHDDLKPIDLVIQEEGKTGSFLRPLEIKLTTLPDNTTSNLPEDSYGCELVVRNPTTRYIALSLAQACQKRLTELREILDPVCHTIRSWDNLREMADKKIEIFSALEEVIVTFRDLQKPLLLQPVWKTLGKSAILSENCLDIFVWSDFGLTRLFMSADNQRDPEKISRPERTALRLARCLYEISSRGKVYQQPIYDGMTFDTLNDKEFAISGARTNAFMRSPRLTNPIVTKDKIKEIILGGGQKYLSPERRFDAIIYFSRDLFDENGEASND